MRLRICLLLAAGLLAACGGSSGNRSVEGRWTSTETVGGTQLTLDLNEERGGVAGNGTYKTASGQTGSLLVSGSSQSGANVHLFWTYDFGDQAEYVATMPDEDHMSGTLTTTSAAVPAQTQPLGFVRQ